MKLSVHKRFLICIIMGSFYYLIGTYLDFSQETCIILFMVVYAYLMVHLYLTVIHEEIIKIQKKSDNNNKVFKGKKLNIVV